MKLSERIERDRRKKEKKLQMEYDKSVALHNRPLGWLERLHWRRYIRKNIAYGGGSVLVRNLNLHCKYNRSISKKFHGGAIDLDRAEAFCKWLADEGLYYMWEDPGTDIRVLSAEGVEDYRYDGDVYLNEANRVYVCCGKKTSPEAPGNWRKIFEKTKEE